MESKTFFSNNFDVERENENAWDLNMVSRE